ncbi:unnamed protein product [Paramecium octaurelia]|uniref:Protein kinase domain-containing protein n=1 Tax=Paramecium octaurelia TaxID=43137 RepID=A0A8S1TFT8_PAROT|nr:unnamed protein product [Paramecium octaurelia]
MEFDQTCTQHPKQKISWVCLEKQCQQRVMCSPCAVKIHEKSHKLEELSNLLENGVLQTYQSNSRNLGPGLKYLIKGESELIQEENRIRNENAYFQTVVEKNLKVVQKKMDVFKKEFLEKQKEIKLSNQEERNKVINELEQVNQQLKVSENMGNDIEEAFQKIQTYVNHKEYELKNNKEAEIVNKKIYLLNLMKDNYLKMIKVYFSNAFTIEFCKLFDMQMETLNSKEVQDVNGFLDYVDSKWKQDYKNLQVSIEKFVQKLHEGLKYIIQLPLQEEKGQLGQFPVQPIKQQVIVPQFASPARNAVQYQQQPYFIPLTPFNQVPSQYQFHQQQIPQSSQRLYQNQNQFHSAPAPKCEVENDYFAQSQIIYEEPHVRNNTRPDFVSQKTETPIRRKISIEDFIKIQQMGDGAYSTVYSCQKKEDLQKGNSNQCPIYAIKIIDKNFMKLNKKQHHAYIEKEMLQYLKYDGIIKLHSTFQDKNNLYFLVELASDCFGEFLKLYGNQKLTHQIIQFYTAEIVSILEYIHSKGIVHRDIKPENLLITEEKHLKLIDFGTAVIYDQEKVPPKIVQAIENYRKDFVDTERRRQYSFVGTNAYLTPEMISDKPVGPGTDLWALAIMMYKMYTGTIPFKTENQEDSEDLYKKIVKDQIIFPQSIPKQAQDLMKLFLEKDLNDRLVDYSKIKSHPYFADIDFTSLWQMNPPQPLQIHRDQRKSKTFVQEPISKIIFQEMVEKDSGFLISYYSPRLLVLQIINDIPSIHYTNPKLNDKKTVIHVTQFLKYQLLKQDKFVIIDEKQKYIFKSQNAKKWISLIGETLNNGLK